MTVTKDQFFKPGRMSAQEKASTTDTAARQIVAAEASARERKTERLRQLRVAQEATIPLQSPPSRKRTAKTKPGQA